MKSEYHYEPGAVRWREFRDNSDVRCYRAKEGWSVQAHQLSHHPITGKPLPSVQWWIRECFKEK